MGTLSIVYPGSVVSLSSRGDGLTTEGWAGQKADSTFASDDATLLNGLTIEDVFVSIGQTGNNITRQITFGFDQNTPVFSLDGNPAISYNSLPGGFQINSLQLSVQCIVQLITGNTTATIQVAGVNTVGSPAAIPNNGNVTFTYNFPVSLFTTNTKFISTQFLFQFQALIAGNAQNFAIDAWSLTGTYSIVNFQYQYTITPANPLSNVGDIITITSNGASALLLNDIAISITYFDSSNIFHAVPISPISQSTNLFTFLMPNFDGAVQVTIDATGNGVQFSGTVPLGTLPTINFTDGSGIYVLTPGQAFDTLYAQGTNPIQTVNMAIPNPFIKTGFIP